MADVFHVFRVFRKVIERRVITDEGAFAEEHVPEDYGGPQLTLEIIQRVTFADSAGHLLELRFDDLEGLMDEERQTGVGVDLTDLTGEVVFTQDPVAPSTLKATWTEVEVTPSTGPNQLSLSPLELEKAKYVEDLKKAAEIAINVAFPWSNFF